MGEIVRLHPARIQTVKDLFEDAVDNHCTSGLFVGFTDDGDHYVQATGNIKLADLAFAEKLVELAVTDVLRGK